VPGWEASTPDLDAELADLAGLLSSPTHWPSAFKAATDMMEDLVLELPEEIAHPRISGVFMYSGEVQGFATPPPAQPQTVPKTGVYVYSPPSEAPEANSSGGTHAWVMLQQILNVNDDESCGNVTHGSTVRSQERRAAAIAAQCAHMEPSPSEEERWRPDGDEWALGSKGADWPAIAMFRRTQVLRIMERIAAEFCCGPTPRFVKRKSSADVFNKWIFQATCASSSRQGWQGARPATDAVIPSSCETPAMMDYLRRQLQSAFPGEQVRMTEKVATLVRQCAEAANRVQAFGIYYAKELSTNARIEDLTDEELGLTVRVEQGSGGEPGSVILQWQDMQMGLWEEHYSRLVAVYDSNGHNPMLKLARIFSMVVRYETLTEVKSAYQAALPRSVMSVLREDFGVRQECFASPLNCFFERFCSLFPDTDRFFGSEGSFFDFNPQMGSFECNPPFDQHSIVCTLKHIHDLLVNTEAPLSFFVCIPRLDMSSSLKMIVVETPEVMDMLTGRSALLKHRVVVPRHKHAYLMGLQHRKTGGSRHWVSSKDSVLSWFQNAAGSEMWPAEEAKVQRLVEAFQTVVSSAEEVGEYRRGREANRDKRTEKS